MINFIVAIPIVLLIRLISPVLLIRVGVLVGDRIGHFAANTELYLCEKEAGIHPRKKYQIDLFYLATPACNQQLEKMWRRVVIIGPEFILHNMARVNHFIPGGKKHEVENTAQSDRDVHNLLERYETHLDFTEEEKDHGETVLRLMGIPNGAPFVCLIVRDEAYLKEKFKEKNYSYHDYRNSDIRNYLLAAEELAKRGCYVIRMGALVNTAFESTNSKIIDYATNGMRTDFMDIYLGAKCKFCISVGTGFDAIPLIFRRPVAYVNMVPIGYFFSFMKDFIGIFKYHISTKEGGKLSLSDIFSHDVGFSLNSSEYKNKGVTLVENTPEDIRELVIEMFERLEGAWQSTKEDRDLQDRFWELFKLKAIEEYEGSPLHGECYSRIGSSYLRNNLSLLE